MKGSVFVLLGCFALFAAPSHSYPASEGDQLANSQDAQSGSPSTDARTLGDAVERTDTSAGEGGTVKMDGDAKPRNESVAGDAQAEKSKIRKRDTTSSDYDYDEGTGTISYHMPMDKEYALHVFGNLVKYGGECFEKAFNYIREHELPKGFYEEWLPEAIFKWSDMTKWLGIMKDMVSECLIISAHKIIDESNWNGKPDHPKDTFANMTELFSPLAYVGKAMRKSADEAIRHLVETAPAPSDTALRSSESLPDLLMELVNILSIIVGKGVPAGDTGPMLPPGGAAAPYLDSVPATTTYKKSNFPDEPRVYRYHGESRHYLYDKDTPAPVAPQSSGFRGEAIQIPYAPGMTTLPEEVNALSTPQLSLLNVVLGKIYSRLQGEVSPAAGMEAAPVEGLRVDENGAFYLGSGQGPAMGVPGSNPECAQRRRVQ